MTLEEIKTEMSKLAKKREAYVKFRDSFIPSEELNSIFSTLQLIISKFPNIKLDDGNPLCGEQFEEMYELVNKCNVDLTNINTLINNSLLLIDNRFKELVRQKNALLVPAVNSNKTVSTPSPVTQSSSMPKLTPKGPSFKANMIVKEM